MKFTLENPRHFFLARFGGTLFLYLLLGLILLFLLERQPSTFIYISF